MRRLRQWFKAVLVALLFAAGLSAVGLVFPVLGAFPLNTARRARAWIQVSWYAGLLRVLGASVRVSGTPCHDSALWVSNHISWLDIVVLGARRSLTFVAKAEVGEWPVVGFMARRTGTLLVRRGDVASSRQVAEHMLWLLRQQQAVALFPEGTSTDGSQVLRFHARLFAPAVRVGASVQVIAIAYPGAARDRAPFVGNDEFLPHLWRLLGERSIDVALHFCPPLAAGAMGRDALAELARAQVVQALGGECPSATERRVRLTRA